MKRLIIIVFLIFVFISVKVKAADILITTPKTINEEYICSEEYIQFNDVNWDEVGSGKVNYFDKNNLNFKTKNVLIKDIESLKQGINIPIESSVAIDSSVNISKIIYKSDDEFFILGKLDNNYYPYPSELDKGFAYLAYYKNYSVQWEKLFKENRYGRLVDGVLIDSGIIIYGEYDNQSQKTNVFVNIISFDKKVLYEKEIEGSLNDYAKAIYYMDNVITFCGLTESKDRDFMKYSEVGYDIFIGSIHLPTNDFKLQLTGNRGNDIYISSAFLNGNLYLYCYFKGEGFYHNNNGNMQNFKCIIEADSRLDCSVWASLEDLNNELNDTIFIFGDKICIANFSYGDSIIHFWLFDLKLNFQIRKSLKINNISKINEYKIATNNNNFYITTLATDTKNIPVITTHCINNEFNEISYYSTTTIKTDSKILDFIFYNSKLKINILDNSNSKLNIIDYSHLKIQDYKVNFDKYYINDYNVIVNGNIVSKNRISSNVSNNPYGSYYDIYSALLDDFELILEIEKFYYDSINLKTKEEYDLGTVLKFNGTGYLNDELIANNYKLNEAGKYVLEIVGNFDERKVINFTVKDLSYNPIPLEDFVGGVIESQKTSNSINRNIEFDVYGSVEEELDKNALIIILSSITVGLSLGIFLPINFWRRKYA